MHDGGIEADETELVDVGFQVDARAAVRSQVEQVIEAPERGGEGVADAFLSAAGVRVDLVDAVIEMIGGEKGLEVVAGGNQTLCRASRRSMLDFGSRAPPR